MAPPAPDRPVPYTGFSQHGNHLDRPLVSVVVRSMGRDSLPRALDSIAMQTYPVLEVVVVDALGSDHPEVPVRCGPHPVRVSRTPGSSLGRSQAANAGLRAATGTFVVFLDDDDRFLPRHIEQLVAALTLHGQALVAYAGVVGVAPDGTAVHTLNMPFSLPRLRLGNFIPIHAAAFARSLVEAGCSFDENLELFEDWDFWLQLAERTAFVHVDTIGAEYRMGGGSGVGLDPQHDLLRQGRARVLDKWRLRWTGEQIDAMLDVLYDEVRAHDQRISEQDEIIARQATELQRVLSSTPGRIWRLARRLKTSLHSERSAE